ncbi:MAG: hypothetical protein P4N24_01325 [Acidobacteriota bacterium]|jgi:hypothetical protein|nr:hypothetical protein [Acidobacteriota bacterium]
MNLVNNPDMIPLVGVVASMVTAIAIVGTVYWHKTRTKELQFHQDLRIREMEHQRKIKELEVEMERIKARSIPTHVA